MRTSAAGAVLLMCVCGFLPQLSAADEKPNQRQPSSIQAEISKLESTDFKARQQATRLLLKMGDRAIEPLLKRIRTARLELAIRAVSIFEAAYTGKDPAAAAAADRAIEELALSKRQELAEQALGVLARNEATRIRFAISHLTRLGAVTYNYYPGGDPERERGRLNEYLVLDKQWKGGVEGLKYLTRLTESNFQIYLIDGVPIPEKAIVEVESSFIRDRVSRRGPAMLGISAGRGQGCMIAEVVKGGSADKAKLAGSKDDTKLRPGDVILAIDGKPIEDFTQLVDLLRPCKVGQTIVLKVERDDLPRGRIEDIEVTLGKWRPTTAPQPKAKKAPAQKP